MERYFFASVDLQLADLPVLATILSVCRSRPAAKSGLNKSMTKQKRRITFIAILPSHATEN